MPTKPRVLVFHPAPAPYRTDLFNELARACHLRVVFLMDTLPGQALHRQALHGPLAAEHGLLRRGLTVKGYALRFGYAAEVSRFRPDVVVTSEFGASTLTAAWLAGGVASRKFDHVVWTDDNPESIRLDPPAKRVLRRLLLPHVKGLLAVSDEAADCYRDHFGFRRPIGGVPILQCDTRFRQALELAADDALALALAHELFDRRILLYVGRLSPEKGLTALLDAFAAVAAEFEEVRLVLVGDGPCRTKLEKQALSLGITSRVVFAGHAQRPTLLAWYRIGGALILPSRLERFGAVINEALLAGLFVGCSRYAGAGVLVRSGRNGRVFDPAIPAQFRATLSESADRAEPLTQESIKQVRANLMPIDFDHSVRGFMELVLELRRPGAAVC
jgi:glycosyltransferase involved in cell wall biosynthesis